MSNSPKPVPVTPLTPRRRAILVGASGGIGAFLSRRLAREGYILALVDRNAEALTFLCNEINRNYGGTRAVGYVHDVTDYDSVPDLLRKIIADSGGLDLFVYLAGIIYFPALDEYNFEQDRKVMEVNLIGAMAWLSRVAPLFQSMKGGQLVGISSVAGDRGRVANPANSASKGGLAIYLESLRNRLTRHGVNVITIKPGFVKTDMLRGVNKVMFAVEPEQAADAIYNAIRKRKQQVYISGIWYWIMLVIRNIPSVVFRRLTF